MQFSLEAVASVATIAGTVVAVIALIQSSAWLALICCLLAGFAVAAGLYAREQRRRSKASSVVIEGHSIDSLNAANLLRRVNRSFFVQESLHTIRIEDRDMHVTWQYSGYCKVTGTSAMEFSVDSDAGTPFEKLNCTAYDLRHDPAMVHEIRPLLVSAEGISKKVSVPFLKSLDAQEPFAVMLNCTLPGCLKPGFGYYSSTFSFAQARVQRCAVRLVFVGTAPQWVRVYDGAAGGQHKLLKTLAVSSKEIGRCEYTDVVDGRHGRSARVYAFWRE